MWAAYTRSLHFSVSSRRGPACIGSAEESCVCYWTVNHPWVLGRKHLDYRVPSNPADGYTTPLRAGIPERKWVRWPKSPACPHHEERYRSQYASTFRPVYNHTDTEMWN